jgi:hypothetical protein
VVAESSEPVPPTPQPRPEEASKAEELVVQLTARNFRQVGDGSVWLIEFYAPWCSVRFIDPENVWLVVLFCSTHSHCFSFFSTAQLFRPPTMK